MATILAIHKSVENTLDKVNELGYMTSQLDNAKYDQHVKAYKELQSNHNWKAGVYSLAIVGALWKVGFSAISTPESNWKPIAKLGEMGSTGAQMGASGIDGSIARTNGDIEKVRNLLNDVSTRKRQLNDILDQVTRRAEETMRTLAQNSHSQSVG